MIFLPALLMIVNACFIYLIAFKLPWTHTSVLSIFIQIGCFIYQGHFIIKQLRRDKEMRKDLCDCCGKELFKDVNGDQGIFQMIVNPISIFRAKAVFKITQFTLHIPFGTSHKDMDICQKCMDDFKEFIQRKKSYHAGGKS